MLSEPRPRTTVAEATPLGCATMSGVIGRARWLAAVMCLLLPLATAGTLVLPSGAMTSNTPSPAVRSELAPTGKLRVGINYQNFLLVTAGGAEGEPRGPAPDLARELARRLEAPIEFVRFETAGKLADAVRTGAWDVAFLGAEPQRADEIAFTAAY